MKLELTVIELGKALKKIEENYKLDLLVKNDLSGGWMTMIGEATIDRVPTKLSLGCSNKGNNIINIRIKDDSRDGSVIKLTGAKGKKFNIDISSTRYRELSKNSLNIDQIKINANECKLRIDKDIIFTIKAGADEIVKIIK